MIGDSCQVLGNMQEEATEGFVFVWCDQEGNGMRLISPLQIRYDGAQHKAIVLR